MEMEREAKRSFECSDVKIINPVTIQITISKDPITPNCGSYYGNGKSSLPTCMMLIRHTKTGYDFITQCVNKQNPYAHNIILGLRTTIDDMPKVEIGDTFISAGFIMPEIKL